MMLILGRVLFMMWAAGCFVISLSVLSRLLFEKNYKVKTAGQHLSVAAVWPVALLTEQGRNQLTKTLEGKN